MLESLLGSRNRERVLIFIYARRKGYAREISRFYGTDLTPVQHQLERLESGSVLCSETAGRTRLFSLNPRYPFLKELQALLEKALTFYPEELKDRLTLNRRRPRRPGKPL